jgi:hypothetical protein
MIAANLALALAVLSSGTASAGEATPGTAAPIGSVPAEDLSGVLLAARFPAHELPGGRPVTVRPWTGDGDDELEGTVGAVEVVVRGDVFPLVTYLIYPDAAVAEERFARPVDDAGTVSTTPPGFERPALLTDYGGLALCRVLAENVLVLGAATGAEPDRAVADAVANAAVALRHLERLVADFAAGTRPTYASGLLADEAPFTFFELLLTTPIPDDLLPAGFAGGPLTRWEEGDTDLIGTIGGAYAFFAGGEAGLAFLVYPNEAGAQAKFDERVDDAVAEGLGVVAVEGISYPSRLMSFEDYGVCIVRVGYVLVIGSGGLDQNLAIDLARAGVAHVETLAAASAPATPAA